ncbi:MAG TPA: glycosyltransferase family 39 protein [Chryseolinea sp.]|nr:glycosyltransferase family 39 protein [Chryseolinea sp.]
MNKVLSLPTLVSDIRFWIVLFFLLRLYGITFPPLEVGHNWRQTDGLMIARNFYERDANIFYPRVDVGGEKTGIVGSEFPILNYIIYVFALVFGYEHWYGRLIVLLSSCIGTYFFHKLILKYFGEQPAFNGTVILLVSLWFSYSRKIIPDVFALSLCLVGIYQAVTYLESGKFWKLLLCFLLCALGCLAKISAATLLTVLFFPLLSRSIPLSRKILLSFASGGILLVVCWWYFIWVPYLNETYGLGDHFFMGLPLKEGIRRILESWPPMLKRFYDTPMKYTGFAAFLFAIILLVRNRQWLAVGIFLLPFCSFLIILVKTGTSVIGDTYYVLTIIPPMAFVTGYGLSYIGNKRLVAFILLVVSVENIAAQIYDFRIREPFRSLQNLEGIMDQVSQRDDLILTTGLTHDPTVMYFAHRRGWVASEQMIKDSSFIATVRGHGCKYILITKKHYGDFTLDMPVLHDSEYFKIYRLN